MKEKLSVNLTKKMVIALYILIVVCIGFATVIEKFRGTTFVSEHIYGAWWFSALWAVLTVASCAYIMKQQLYKRMAVLLLHLSFVVILAGALTTHLFARRGTVGLRTGVTEISFIDHNNKVCPLPFALTLKEFRIVTYPGTDAPMDYQSVILYSCTDGEGEGGETRVSMNNIGNIDGYRLFQQSYDSDGKGVTLGVCYDPYGIGITYVGYLLLLVGIIATLLSKTTQMRSLYHQAMGDRGQSCASMDCGERKQACSKVKTLMAALLLVVGTGARAAEKLPSVDPDIAHRMGTIHVLYNNRICPLNTVATDFAIKLTGGASWHGYSADEIFFSWMIFYTPWEKELLHNNPREKGAADRQAVVEMFYNGQFTRIFPYRVGSQVNWYSPGGQVLPREIPVKEQFFIKQSMDFLTEAIVTGQRERALEIIAKIKLFQREMIGDLLPSETKTQAELFYNKLRSIKFPVLITLQLGLRWWLSGHIPLSNGYETMLFMAWVLLVLTAVLYFLPSLSGRGRRRGFRIILVIGPLAALCCLLVAMMTGGGSEISPLMPVLQSPLLSVHVMTVMCAYALFALQLMIGIYTLILIKRGHLKHLPSSIIHQTTKLTALSQLLLYPAVFLLTIGIFLGAVWANVSWGTYWSWDPKETWALITLMVYAVPFHSASLPAFRRPRVYHLYMVCAFLSVVITYFGVNFLLGGMHSYA